MLGASQNGNGSRHNGLRKRELRLHGAVGADQRYCVPTLPDTPRDKAPEALPKTQWHRTVSLGRQTQPCSQSDPVFGYRRALGKSAIQPHRHTATNLVSAVIDYS
jgi:hypothetical protein